MSKSALNNYICHLPTNKVNDLLGPKLTVVTYYYSITPPATAI